MSFYPKPHPVPDELKTAQFALRPLNPAHVELDFEALMDSVQMLRLWSGSPWPMAEFSLADNLTDLERHYREHQERIAFTYTVLSPDEATCLGCIYTKPLQMYQKQLPEQFSPITKLDAATCFWIREPYLTDRLDKQLLNVLIDWFEDKWQFDRHFFYTRAAHEQQVQLFDRAGLVKQFLLDLPSSGGEFSFCA